MYISTIVPKAIYSYQVDPFANFEINAAIMFVSEALVANSYFPSDRAEDLFAMVCCGRFDYSSGDSIEYSGETQDVVRAVASGHCDAIFMWWDLEMDTQGQISLSCAPGWAHPTPDNMQVRTGAATWWGLVLLAVLPPSCDQYYHLRMSLYVPLTFCSIHLD